MSRAVPSFADIVPANEGTARDRTFVRVWARSIYTFLAKEIIFIHFFYLQFYAFSPAPDAEAGEENLSIIIKNNIFIYFFTITSFKIFI